MDRIAEEMMQIQFEQFEDLIDSEEIQKFAKPVDKENSRQDPEETRINR